MGLAYPGFDSRAAKLIVSWTVKDPIKASSCSTYELNFRNAARDGDVPLTDAWPSTLAPAFSRLAKKFKRVVFPDPLGPMSAHISPVNAKSQRVKLQPSAGEIVDNLPAWTMPST